MLRGRECGSPCRLCLIDESPSIKSGPHQQQCQSNVRVCSIRQRCFDIVAVWTGLNWFSDAVADAHDTIQDGIFTYVQ